MDINEQNAKLFLDNAIILANIIELGASVINKMAGNDISTLIDNDPIEQSLKGLMAAKISQRMAHYNAEN